MAGQPAGKFGLAYNASLTINSVALTSFTRSVSFAQNAQPLDLRAMGDLYTNEIQGLKSVEMAVSLWQSFYTSQVHDTLKGLYNNGTQFTSVVLPYSPTVGTENPSFSFTGYLPGYNPIDMVHGDGLSTDIVVRLTGGGTTGVTEATA